MKVVTRSAFRHSFRALAGVSAGDGFGYTETPTLAQVEAIRTDPAQAGIQLEPDKTVGVDALPAGASISGQSVVVTGTGVSFERWDFANYFLDVRGTAQIDVVRNCRFTQSAGSTWTNRMVDLYAGAQLDLLEYCDFQAVGSANDLGSVIGMRTSGSGASATGPIVGVIQRNRFYDFPSDGIKSTSGGIIRWNYFETANNLPYEPPIWDPSATYSTGDYVQDGTYAYRSLIDSNTGNTLPTGKTDNTQWENVDPHADSINPYAAVAALEIYGNYVNRSNARRLLGGGFGWGVNNGLRLAMNTASDLPHARVVAHHNVIAGGEELASFPVQMEEGTGHPNFVPDVVADNWITPNSGDSMVHPDWDDNAANVFLRNTEYDQAAAIGAVTAILFGQSEMEYLLNTGAFYRAITNPTPGDGNLVVYTQDGAGNPVVKTTVNATTVAAGQVNPAMAAMSAFLEHVRPGRTFVLGDGAVPGTSRYALVDDADTDRLWTDLTAVIDAIEGDYGPVGLLCECWYNADASSIETFRDCFWPLYFGRTGGNAAFTLGNTNPDAVNTTAAFDHCLWDGDAATNSKGRGVFRRDQTSWAIITPMPFLDAPIDPTPEMLNFSADDDRLTEPARAVMIALADNPLAQSVNLVVGPSAHVCQFGGGTSTQIHPAVDSSDGQILLMWPIAFALARQAGYTIAEPTIIDIDGPGDGSYVEVVVDLPNGGTLTTLAALESRDAYAGTAPHQQAVTGFEMTKSGTRRPVFNTDETSYPASHRGTVAIVDSGTGVAPNRFGRVRITPTEPFGFGDSVSYLRGQATAALVEPRDLDLYPYFLIEHVPALADSGVSLAQRCPGVAVRPYQADLAAPVDEPTFTPQSTSFNGTSSVLESISLNVPTSNRFTIAGWLWFDGTWGATTGTWCHIRIGTTQVVDIRTASSGRLQFIIGGFANFTTPTSTFTGNRWHHVAISVDVTSGSEQYQISIDGGAPIAGTPSAVGVTLGLAAGNATRFYVGRNSTTSHWTGDLGHLFIDLQNAIDLSNSANRLKLVNADGDPPDYGATGQNLFGSTPQFYFDGGASMANLGTGGSLAATDLTAGGTPALP